MTVSPRKALEKLKQGLTRTQTGARQFGSGIDPSRRSQLTQRQNPYAIILGCADSRVPPEYIFDAGLGDLFVCRNAGNVASDTMLDSIEFAAVQLGTPLLLVLGHKGCGAVELTIAENQIPGSASQTVSSLMKLIRPAVQATRPNEETPNREQTWMDNAVKANVEYTCRSIVERSPVIADLITQERFMIQGAVYDIRTGEVKFLD